MGDKVDEIIDSMTPAELAAVEGEIDKRASENIASHYFERGRELAREAVAHYEKTGELPPVLHIIKAATEAAEVDQMLSDCSPEDLATIEADLDSEIESNEAEKSAAFYFNEGVKLAQTYTEKRAAGAGGLLAQFGRFAAKNPGQAMVGAALGGVAAKKLIVDK